MFKTKVRTDEDLVLICEKRRKNIKWIIASAGMLLLAGALMLAFSAFSEHLFPAYRIFSQSILSAFAKITSFVPFALWDIGLALLLITAAVLLILVFCRKMRFLTWFSTVFAVISALVLFFVFSWGLNFYAPPISNDISLTVKKYTKEELFKATEHYLVCACKYASEVPRDSDGKLIRQDFRELAQTAGKSYLPLKEKYSVFSGCTVPPKYLTVGSEYLLYTGSNGLFSAFTGEASVPYGCAVIDVPYTMCHEVAHRSGIASENEANFAAFLACDSSKDARFKYSGYYSAFIYCYNALYKADKSMIKNLFKDKDKQEYILVIRDADKTSEYYDRYSGKTEKVGQKLNDTYLKAFSQESGVKSYGEVVDYLIAWYLK